MLWTDRAGRFSPLKATTLAIAIVPGLWVAYAWGALLLWLLYRRGPAQGSGSRSGSRSARLAASAS